MTKERKSNERFEIVGLTKAEVDRCMEVLCGGPMPWDLGYCFASSDLFARPSRYGPEPSNEGRKPMSDPTGLERARDIVADVVKSLGGEARVGATLALNAIDEALAHIDAHDVDATNTNCCLASPLRPVFAESEGDSQ